MERRPRQIPDRGVIEAAAVQSEAPEVRVRRQQRPQQIQRRRDILHAKLLRNHRNKKKVDSNELGQRRGLGGRAYKEVERGKEGEGL